MQKERERISRDLHDNIGAYSSAMIANTDYLEQAVSDNESKEKVLYLKENARNILNTIRETIWSKPREHHFGDNSMPATRGMYRIGG